MTQQTVQQTRPVKPGIVERTQDGNEDPLSNVEELRDGQAHDELQPAQQRVQGSLELGKERKADTTPVPPTEPENHVSPHSEDNKFTFPTKDQ